MLVEHEGVRLELKLPRGQWAVFGSLFLVLGVPFAVAAPLLLLVAVVDQNVGALVGVFLAGLLGSVSVLAGISAWRISRSHPAIVVGADRLTIEHPGVFVRPVPLSRSAVHSVYVRPFQGMHHRPKFEGTAWKRLRQWSDWLDHRGRLPDPLPISAWHCPDLSILSTMENHNILVVMASSVPLRGVSRRGLGALSLAVARGINFTGPTKATVARGFFAVVLDEDLARRAFESWPMEITHLRSCGIGSTPGPTVGSDGEGGAAGAGRRRPDEGGRGALSARRPCIPRPPPVRGAVTGTPMNPIGVDTPRAAGCSPPAPQPRAPLSTGSS